MDGKLTTAETPLKVQPQTDWNEEVDEADDAMAHQELSQLQQLLGLAEPKNGKPVEDVVFVCIDCELHRLLIAAINHAYHYIVRPSDIPFQYPVVAF